MKPLVLRRQDDLLQLTYELPHRIFSAHVYPCNAPNGSKLIIYAHELGVRVLWRGGLPFRAENFAQENHSANGSNVSQAMIIDLEDDEAPGAGTAVPAATFAKVPEEVDPLRPFASIIRVIDIPLGSAAKQLAIPPVPSTTTHAPAGAYPPIFSTHAIVAAACEDLSIRLIAVPLIPPPSEQDSSNLIQCLRISGPPSHQQMITSITISHTYSVPGVESEAATSKPRSRSRGRSRGTITGSPTDGRNDWSLLVASVSSTAGALLVVHQVPLRPDYISPEEHILLQRQYLGLSLTAAKISFNPSPFPAERHSNLLLTCPDKGCAKICQVLSDLHASSPRSRRGSAATLESTNSSSHSLRSAPRQGQILATLYPGFATLSGANSTPRRKRVLDSSWICGGKAVLALLEDGEWGIWDVEGVAPATSGALQTLLKGQSGVSGLRGGSVTQFAVRGVIAKSAHEAQTTRRTDSHESKTGQLAPMTPHTRKVRSDGLFRGDDTDVTGGPKDGQQARGSICVTENAQKSHSPSSAINDESVLITYGSTTVSISSILSMWRAEVSDKGLITSASALRPVPLVPPRMGGERITCVTALPRRNSEQAADDMTGAGAQNPDLLIAAEHRLIMLVAPLSEGEPSTTAEIEPPFDIDQLLLASGELDIGGVDRVLDGMAGGAPTKSVAFDNVDVDMGTPTPKTDGGFARKRGTPGPSKTSRRLFT